MLRSRLPVTVLTLCLAGASVSATERVPPAAEAAAQQASERQADLQQPKTPEDAAAKPAASDKPASDAQPPAAERAAAPPAAGPPSTQPSGEQPAGADMPAATATPAQPPAPVGFEREFADRLLPGKLGAADRTDRTALAKFYEANQQEPVWITETGPTPAATALMAEIRRADDWGLEASAFRLPAVRAGKELTREQRADAEITLSLALLKYARHARGGRAEPISLSKNIDRKLPLLDPLRVIGDAAKADKSDAYVRGLHPRHPQFELLRQKYLALKRDGAAVPQVQLQPPPQPEPSFNDEGSDRRRSRQARTAPEVPSVRKLLVNMEQWRWMPDELGAYHIWVNIPEFVIRVVKGGRVIHTERVIVGKTDTQTPVFSDEMEQVIFHPFWGVPDSIKKNEIQPSMARGGNMLERHNLRVQYKGRDIDPGAVDWASADMRQYHVYQPPGGENVLGVVKFRFPNKHDVYMHDTPQRNLFNASVRAYSHGCMRVREPQRLAELILAEDKNWPAARVAAAISSGPQNNQVNLSRKFPVHMTYFTAWVESDGQLKLYGDLYGHESRIALGMEGKAHLIPKEEKAPVKPDAISSLSETQSGGRYKKEWIRRVFEN